MVAAQCEECFGDKEVEIAPGVFKKCPICTTKQNRVAINARKVPEDLRHRFRMLCLEKGVSMQDAVVALIQAAVDKNLEIKCQ